MISVDVNGQAATLADGATVADAVRASGADPASRGLAAAVDGEVVLRTSWTEQRLLDGQRVEVVRAVQGG